MDFGTDPFSLRRKARRADYDCPWALRLYCGLPLYRPQRVLRRAGGFEARKMAARSLSYASSP